MKKIVLMLVVALMGTLVTNAQPPRRHDMDPQRMVEQRVERLDKALSLSAEQKAEITKIYSEEMEAMKKDRAARKDKGEKPDESIMQTKRQQMQAQREATDAKVESLLTPEQAAKFAQMKKKQGHQGHGNRHDGRQDGKRAPRHDGGCCCKDK